MFNSNGVQPGNTQTITVGPTATIDDIRSHVTTALGNVLLTGANVGTSKKLDITGLATDFGRVEYKTLTQQGANWIPNSNIKGPAFILKVGSPDFYVNGTKLGP